MRIAAAAVLMLILALPALGAPPRRASLTLASIAPLVVKGKHFGAREPVILTYFAADLTRRVIGVRAKRNGSFKASFELSLDRCAAFTVRAGGIRGSRAVLQVSPDCKNDKDSPKRALVITLDQGTD